MPHDQANNHSISKRRVTLIARAYADRDAKEYALLHMRIGMHPGDEEFYQQGIELIEAENSALENIAEEEPEENKAKRFLKEVTRVQVNNKHAQPKVKLEMMRSYSDQYDSKTYDSRPALDTGREFLDFYRKMCRKAGEKPQF